MPVSPSAPSILDNLSSQKLGTSGVPATRGDERPDPVEREPQRESREVGRRPEDVVQEREEVVQREESNDATPALKKKYKTADGDLSLEEIAARGLIEKWQQSAAQLPHLQQKYQENLEKIARQAEVAEKSPAPVVQERVTQEQITQAFLPMLKEYVDLGYVESDMAEAWPNALTGAMYNTARINDHDAKINVILDWIQAEKQLRNVTQVRGLLDQSIDTVAAKANGEKGEKMYQGLNVPEQRAAFVDWLRKEVNPQVGSITPQLIERQWMAFIAPDLIKFTQEAAAKAAAKPDRRRAASDGSQARVGNPESSQAPTLLDRMSADKLGPDM